MIVNRATAFFLSVCLQRFFNQLMRPWTKSILSFSPNPYCHSHRIYIFNSWRLINPSALKISVSSIPPSIHLSLHPSIFSFFLSFLLRLLALPIWVVSIVSLWLASTGNQPLRLKVRQREECSMNNSPTASAFVVPQILWRWTWGHLAVLSSSFSSLCKNKRENIESKVNNRKTRVRVEVQSIG